MNDEEKKSLRPYRRFVRVLFFLAIAAFCAILLRGIVNTLDRLPTAETLDRPERVDDRALKACAIDLGKLEARVRAGGAEALGAPSTLEAPDKAWKTAADAIELERLKIVARCHLQDDLDDPAARELADAAQRIENLIRSYHFLHARHLKDGAEESREAKRALERALQTLDARR